MEQRDFKKEVGAILALLLFFFVFMYMVYYRNTENSRLQALNAGYGLEFLTRDVEQVEYGDSVWPMDYIKDYKGELELPKVDTKRLGEQKLVYTIRADDYEKKFYKRINVVDTQMPVLEYDGEEVFNVEVGEGFDAGKMKLFASDKVDGKLEIKTNGSISTKYPGKQTVTFYASDNNGNRVEKKIVINVTKPKSEVESDVTIGGSVYDCYKNGAELYVRDRVVSVNVSIEDKVLKEYVKQINETPAFLLDSIDTISIVSNDEIEELSKKENIDRTILGLTLSAGEQTEVFLNADVMPEEAEKVFVHEAAHAYDTKNKITNQKKFEKLYQEENSAGVSQDNKREFFAVVYTLYITEGPSASKAIYPKTTQWLEDNGI